MSAPRVESISINNYRSVGGEPVRLTLPPAGPLVLLGENNSGKSNITRAIDLLFGERWPSTHMPEDHEFYGRNRDGVAIKIGAKVAGVRCRCGSDVEYMRWHFDSQETPACVYNYSCTSCHLSYVSREMREQILCMFIGADRNLGYQLSYASKFTLLSKLMHRFHQALVGDEARGEKLKEIFLTTVAQFESVEEFAEFRTTLQRMTQELGQGLTHLLDIDFSAYDPSNFFRSLRVHPKFAGAVRSFDELGTGQAQILALAFAYAYARCFRQQTGLILVVDEPEAHLHPLAQQWLSRKLGNLASDGLQVVVTTHSPHFVDLARPENLVFVRKGGVDEPTRSQQLARPVLVSSLLARGAHATRTTEQSVGSFYSACATTEVVDGVFAKACVLVEGLTEALAIPELLRLVGMEPTQLGLSFIHVQGIKNIAKWARFFASFDIPVYVICDTDSDKTGKDAKEMRAARADILTSLGVDSSEADFVAARPLHVFDTHAVVEPQFEGAMKELIGTRWVELVTEGAEQVGESKPLLARYAAQRVTLGELQVGAIAVLNDLASRLKQLVSDGDRAALTGIGSPGLS